MKYIFWNIHGIPPCCVIIFTACFRGFEKFVNNPYWSLKKSFFFRGPPPKAFTPPPPPLVVGPLKKNFLCGFPIPGLLFQVASSSCLAVAPAWNSPPYIQQSKQDQLGLVLFFIIFIKVLKMLSVNIHNKISCIFFFFFFFFF